MNKFLPPEKQYEILSKGAADLVSKNEFLKKLKENRPLTIKAGFDPSRPDIHLGHLLLIGKLREFQDLGHKVKFVVGDWTACIGDPSGQNKTRPLLSKEEAKKNAETYISQAMKEAPSPLPSKDKKVLCLYNKLKRLDRKTNFVFNSEWLEKLSLGKFVSDIVSRITLARILERNDFSERYKSQKPIALHEFLYPVLQAYDSVELKADVEIGGTDQLFNLLLGRELQKDFNQEPQCLLTLPLLEGLDGQQKMSQSLNNSLSFKDSPKDIFGKIMSMSDELMIHYWERLGETDADYRLSVENKRLHPMKEKTLLAESLTSAFYGAEAADKAREEFYKVFSKKELPKESIEETQTESLRIGELLKESGLVSSISEARRLIEGGGVQWDGKKITNPKKEMLLVPKKSFMLKIGRKFLKIHIDEPEEAITLEDEKSTSVSDETLNPTGKRNTVPSKKSLGFGGISLNPTGKRNTVPPAREFYLPVLQSVSSRNGSNARDTEEDIVKYFNLSEAVRRERTRDGNARRVFDRMRWAVTHLSKAKLIDIPERGHFYITEAGKKILNFISEQGIKRIDRGFLRNHCSSFKKWENEMI